ncbi:MAG: exonuclease sbcCD subunit D [Gammaproteobacteria bacterium]|nr:MAG: exonuclease sbcCD subunit D [Gammaproteobacteria bacterium]
MEPLRILHTADWHLGHSLHGISREYEHRKFLAWLLDTLQQQKADVLIVAGDIFDTANPPAYAQRLYYDFLSSLNQALPLLDVVIIGGNHDSAMRLDAPRDLLSSMNIHVVGGLPRDADGKPDLEKLLVPLKNASGETAGLCVAMPFLRQADLPQVDPEQSDDASGDALIDGVRQLYRDAVSLARSQMQEGMALVATGHCYMTGARISDLSERKVLGGNQHALPANIFSLLVDYAALGHMHLVQRVGKKDRIRYSGSPIPLSLAEKDYPHQVLLVQVSAGSARVSSIDVPQTVGILQVPPEPEPLETVLQALRRLPDAGHSTDMENWPLLEAQVKLNEPQAGLRESILEALQGRKARLVKITTVYPGSGDALADAADIIELENLRPDDVFRRCYSSRYDSDPDDAMMAAFHELLEQAGQGKH